MAHHTPIARINTGDGRFPFGNLQFSKNHGPIPIEGATYDLRPSSGGKRTSQPPQFTCVRRTQSPIDTALASTTQTGSLSPRPRSFSSVAQLPIRRAKKRLLLSNNGCIILHIWSSAKRQHGDRQSTSRRHCLGKACRSFEQRGPKAIEPFRGESLLENPRALGIAR